jgi:hypothetical protein
MSELKDQIKTLEKDSKDKETQANVKMSELKDQIKTLEKDSKDKETQANVKMSELKDQIKNDRDTYKSIIFNLEQQVKSLENEIKNKDQQIIIDDKNNNKYVLYNLQLETENKLLSETISKLRMEKEIVIRERESYEMTHSQLKLDNKKLSVENEILKESNNSLTEQNKILTNENDLINNKIVPEKEIKIVKQIPEKNIPTRSSISLSDKKKITTKKL